MCYITIQKAPVVKLCMAAQGIQRLIDIGAIAAESADGPMAEAVAAFDRLAESSQALMHEIKEVSPFIRYRSEIMGPGDGRSFLRDLVLCLWNGRHVNLSALFMNATPDQTRIALELISSYTHHGENDPHFMRLAAEIIDEVVNREAEEVAA